MTAERFLHLQRARWRIENNLHWALDNVYKKDKYQTYIENTAVVFNTATQTLLTFIKTGNQLQSLYAHQTFL